MIKSSEENKTLLQLVLKLLVEIESQRPTDVPVTILDSALDILHQVHLSTQDCNIRTSFGPPGDLVIYIQEHREAIVIHKDFPHSSYVLMMSDTGLPSELCDTLALSSGITAYAITSESH